MNRFGLRGVVIGVDQVDASGTQLRFTGRADELAVLSEAFGRTSAGRAAMVLVIGDGGVGKSRLVTEAVRRYGQRGKVVMVASEPADQYWSYSTLSSTLSACGGRSWATLGRTIALPELVRGVDQAVRSGPLTVVLDDLHWADDDSLQAVRTLARDLADRPLTLVGAGRSTAHRRDLLQLCDDADRRGDLIRLSGLTGPEVDGLIATLPRPGTAISNAVDLAMGNPWLISSIVSGRTGGLRLLRIFDHLPNDAVALIRLMSVVPGPFDHSDVVTASGWPTGKVLPLLDDCIAAGAFIESGAALVFAHEVVRVAANLGLPQVVRRGVTKVVAEARRGCPTAPVVRNGLTELLDQPASLAGLDRAFHAELAKGIAESTVDRCHPVRHRLEPWRVHPRERRVHRHGWESLTPAEYTVVRHVTEGLTNRQVALRLSLSHYTVETHLKHVYAKLGVSTRTELVAMSILRDKA